MLAEQCMGEPPGTAEVWRLPTIDHGAVISPVLSLGGYIARIQPARYFQNVSAFGICIALKRKVRRAKQKRTKRRNKRMGWQHTWATKGESSKEYPSL
jgi:hypothetical protein